MKKFLFLLVLFATLSSCEIFETENTDKYPRINELGPAFAFENGQNWDNAFVIYFGRNFTDTRPEIKIIRLMKFDSEGWVMEGIDILLDSAYRNILYQADDFYHSEFIPYLQHGHEVGATYLLDTTYNNQIEFTTFTKDRVQGNFNLRFILSETETHSTRWDTSWKDSVLHFSNGSFDFVPPADWADAPE
jgi:hypothetical protein